MQNQRLSDEEIKQILSKEDLKKVEQAFYAYSSFTEDCPNGKIAPSDLQRVLTRKIPQRSYFYFSRTRPRRHD